MYREPVCTSKKSKCVCCHNAGVSFSKGFYFFPNFSFSPEVCELYETEIGLCEMTSFQTPPCYIYPFPLLKCPFPSIFLSPSHLFPLTPVFHPLPSSLPHLFLTNSFSNLPICPSLFYFSYRLYPVTPAAVGAAGFVASEQYRLCASSPCCLPSPPAR